MSFPEPEHVSREEGLKRINSIIKNLRLAMLTTRSVDGDLHSRPMATQEAEFSGDLWFFTARSSGKVADIRANPNVNVSYAGGDAYVSLAGTASIVTDPAKKRELWSDMLKVWFENGPDDPEVVLIHVEADSGQFWDEPGSGDPISKAVMFFKTFVLRDKTGGGDSGRVEL